MPLPLVIEILSKKECGLCDKAKEVVEQVLGDYPAELKVIDIESDPVLWDRYQERIPVVKINGQESFVYKVHPVTLRKKLDRILEETSPNP